MRADKFLWCVRIFKTRSIAANNCRAEKVWLNGELIKASRELKIGDEVKVRKGPITFTWSIIDFPVSRVGANLVNQYVKDVTDKEQLVKLAMLKERLRHERQRGTGRPTKKERRQLDEFLLDDEF